MEIRWKVISLYLELIFLQLCNGLPIDLENTTADSHTQFLTGIVAILLTICGIVCLVGCLCCQTRNGFKEFRDSPVTASASSDLDHGHINPVANGEFTIFTPLTPPPRHNSNIFAANQQAEVDLTFGDYDVDLWFDGTQRDFPRNKLKYIRELGKGWFGKVVEGAAHGLKDDKDVSWTPTAVRILEASATSRERGLFLQDAVVYRCGDHPNILILLGRCLETVPLLLLQEYCSQGDLKKYLLEHRPTADKLLSSNVPLIWSCSLASALKHLHQNKIAHSDVAARNCQLTSNLSLKLGDYGLAVNHYPDDYYQGAPAIPVRWCAPESLTFTCTTLQPKAVTPEGNIWSLGVTLWEIFECGAQPYGWLSDDAVISQVLGSRSIQLPCPSAAIFYIDYIYRLLLLCCSSIEMRPEISQIELMLNDLLQEFNNTQNIDTKSLMSTADFEKRWQSFKPNSVVRTDNHNFSELEKDNDNDLTNMNPDEGVNAKELSASLNNLHGSLDNLVDSENSQKMESWLENVAAKTGDMQYIEGLSQAMQVLDNALVGESTSSSGSSHQPSPAPEIFIQNKDKLEFKLGPINKFANGDVESLVQNDSLTDSMLYTEKTASESETEDETWKKKIEIGAYSEKVHQKSKSVTDLMVLTHIECSESDSETPLPSLDYRVNHRNVRQNLENMNLTFGSEGNLLNVEETFQQELKRLQEGRRDSLLFVPDNITVDKKCSKNTECVEQYFELSHKANSNTQNENTLLNESEFTNIRITEQFLENEKLCCEQFQKDDVHANDAFLASEDNRIEEKLNVEVTPTYSPTHSKYSVTDMSYEILNKPELSEEKIVVESETTFEVPKLVDLIENNDELMNYIIEMYDSNSDTAPVNKENFENEELKETRTTTEENDVRIAENFSENKEQLNKPEIQLNLDENQHEVSQNSIIHSPERADNCEKSSVILGACDDYAMDFYLGLKTAFKDGHLIDVGEEERLQFSSNFMIQDQPADESPGAKKQAFTYSLDTWNDFLGESFNNQQKEMVEMFHNFSDEPRSMLIVNNLDAGNAVDTEAVECKNPVLKGVTNLTNNTIDASLLSPYSNISETSMNSEYSGEGALNHTYTIIPNPNETFILETGSDGSDGSWEPSSGWFLHPQGTPENSLTQIDTQQSTSSSESYVGFGIDDEIMTAIRNELLIKLPKAQGVSTDILHENDDWDSVERDEVLIKYNVYNTPLSPIPEEENEFNFSLVRNEQIGDNENTNNSEFSRSISGHNSSLEDTDTHSVPNIESPILERLNRHTPSQDSCCSNDTLFNLEDLACIIGECEKDIAAEKTEMNSDQDDETIKNDIEEEQTDIQIDTILLESVDINSENPTAEEQIINGDVIEPTAVELKKTKRNEVNNNEKSVLKDIEEAIENIINVSETSANKAEIYENDLKSHIVNKLTELKGLPDLENDCAESQVLQEQNEHKNFLLPDLIENCPKIDSSYITEFLDHERHHDFNKILIYKNSCLGLEKNHAILNLVDEYLNSGKCEDESTNIVKYVNTSQSETSKTNEPDYVNVINATSKITNGTNYVNVEDLSSTEDYANVNNESCINTNHKNNMEIEYDQVHTEKVYVNGIEDDCDENLYSEIKIIPNAESNEDLYSGLADIRFTGPCDNQLMTTSFSDEQDWDSGSDTRSSSSGEFIWKEGEHEESVKALRAAPQDLISMDKITPMEDIEEENSDSSESEEESESPEFVPSAWDKHAIPIKSAMRSPEKILEKTVDQKKSRGVWFKKQKYHSVYEYPKEPESPLQSSNYELWKPIPNFNSLDDWEIDANTFTHTCDESDLNCELKPQDKPQKDKKIKTFYQFTSLPDFSTENVSMLDDDFYISSSARPFETVEGPSSQFFPGHSITDHWLEFAKSTMENVTPDSGVEDITPASVGDNGEYLKPVTQIQTLKVLAENTLKKNTNQTNQMNNKDSLGGLRHTRNKLKLDLPPSPSAFTSNKVFAVEPILDPVINRELPTFTTFGKSRFLVQHVDTPTIDEKEQIKNVSFEALPYKPIAREYVRGEASLLDSADEDSGIESSTLERKTVVM